MRLPLSDTLVFFGATGDLIYKKIFPALYAMERRGHLKVPVIEAAWAVVQPILGKVTPVHIYEPGTWGPSEVEKLSAGISGCPNSVWRLPHGKLL